MDKNNKNEKEKEEVGFPSSTWEAPRNSFKWSQDSSSSRRESGGEKKCQPTSCIKINATHALGWVDDVQQERKTKWIDR